MDLQKTIDKYNLNTINIEGDLIISKNELEDIINEAQSEQLLIKLVSQQREMLLAYEEFTSYKVLGKKTPRISKQMVDDYLANNCAKLY